MPNTIIIGISSGIGSALADYFAKRDHEIVGTYNNTSPSTNHKNLSLNLNDKISISGFLYKFKKLNILWDNLIFCPGTMNPIGPFKGINFDKWRKSFDINFFSQLETLQMLLPFASNNRYTPSVIFFAGGGTNSAPRFFSSYTTAKIALIKMTELLDAEIEDVKFSVVGPGWVKTKIHNEVLFAGSNAPEAARETRRRLENNDFNPTNEICECVDWVIRSEKRLVGGRNFSSQHDRWRSEDICEKLNNDNMYKLRRYGNDP